VPINNLVQVEGTPLSGTEPLDPFEFVRTIAVARITMPRTRVRLSAGREHMDEALQALCFAAGANSIFYGERLLTTANPQAERDRAHGDCSDRRRSEFARATETAQALTEALNLA
jgi:biotin synthase